MKRTLTIIILALVAMTIIPADLFGQAQIYTRKEKLKDINRDICAFLDLFGQIFSDDFSIKIVTKFLLNLLAPILRIIHLFHH